MLEVMHEKFTFIEFVAFNDKRFDDAWKMDSLTMKTYIEAKNPLACFISLCARGKMAETIGKHVLEMSGESVRKTKHASAYDLNSHDTVEVKSALMMRTRLTLFVRTTPNIRSEGGVTLFP